MKRKFELLFWGLYLSSAAFAEAQGGSAPPAAAAPSFGELLFQMLPMLAIVYFIFYFIVVKPQQDKARSQDQMFKSLKRGDNVVTSSGIHGKVASVEDGAVSLEVSPNVKIKVESGHIVRKDEPKSVGSENVKKKAAS